MDQAPGADLVLAKIDSAKQYLAEARSLMDVKNVIAIAAAAKVYARQVQASVETINRAVEIRLRAERRLGELLKDAPKAKGASAGGKKESSRGPYQEPRDKTPTLAESGISKKLSSRAQKLASIPVEQFEDALSVPKGEELEQRRVFGIASPLDAPEGSSQGRNGFYCDQCGPRLGVVSVFKAAPKVLSRYRECPVCHERIQTFERTGKVVRRGKRIKVATS